MSFESITDGLQRFLKSIDLEAKANPPTVTGSDWTAFFFACHYGHSYIVKLMLEYSSKVAINFNVRSGHADFTPFMVACGEGQFQTVKLLLENATNLNIDVNATNMAGFNGLIGAIKILLNCF